MTPPTLLEHDRAAAVATPAPSPVGILRQAIVDTDRRVYGYQWRAPATLAEQRPHASNRWLDQALNRLDQPAAHGKGTLGDATRVFVPIGHAQAVQLANQEHTGDATVHSERQSRRWVAEIAPTAHDSPAQIRDLARTLARLQAQGVRLAFDHTVLTPAYAAWLPLAHYIRMDFGRLESASFERLACCAQTYSHARLIATGIRDAGQVVQVTGYGIQLLQGDWLSPASPLPH